MHRSSLHSKGFTIVELLIVIVVIGVLTTLVITVYTGVQTRTANTARVNEAKEWAKLLSSQVAFKGTYPNGTSGGGTCLGRGFQDYSGDGVGDCWDLDGSCCRRSESATLNNALTSITNSLPYSQRIPIKGADGVSRIGPAFIDLMPQDGTYEVIYWIDAKNGDTCPIGAEYWTDGTTNKKTLACQIPVSPT